MNNNLQKTLCNGMLYGLKVQDDLQKTCDIVLELTDRSFNENVREVRLHYALTKGYKPYLFSIDYLNKEIEFRGERFVPIDRLKSNPNWYVITDCDKVEKYVFEILELISTGGWTGQLPSWIIDQLRAWMFNVDGLEEDQFIRVTETNNPYR